MPFFIDAQELPPIQNYATHEYFGENQNWAITQAKNQNIYIANNKGLLEFNGARWEIYNLPDETIIRSVLAVENRIYSGCYMEFGYWEKDSFGFMNYTSLSKEIHISKEKDEHLIEDEEFWNIIKLDDGVLFQSLDRIYIYNDKEKTFKIINSDSRIIKMYLVNDEIYFQRINSGIYKLKSGNDLLVSNHPVLKTNIIVNVFQKDEGLLILTQDNGFYEFKENVLQPWTGNVNETIKKFSIYNSIPLTDGSIVLGTISNGIVIIGKEGEIKNRINQEKGLSNNTILSLFEDQSKNIWLGLDNGIDCINMQSAFKVFNDNKGELGAVYTSIIYKNKLYIGTNQGLFYKPINSHIEFKFIDGTQGQVWVLKKIDDILFCGHNAGTFIISNDNARLVSNVQGTWDLKAFPNNSSLLLQGNYDGLNILEKLDGEWKYKNKVEGFSNSSQFFEFVETNEILVAHEYKGIYKITLDNDYTKAIEVSVDTLKRGLNAGLIKYNNELLYTYKEGVFKYDYNEKGFLKDSILSSVFTKSDYSSGKLVVDQDNDRRWFFTKTSIGYIGEGKLSNTPKINMITLPSILRNTLSGNENILHLNDNNYLLGTTHGYITIDLDKVQPKDYQINLDIISSKKNRDDDVANLVNKSTEAFFENNENNFDFSYSVSEFDKYFIPEYQYKLDGLYNFWSQWSADSKQVFENLPYGNYMFKVRGKLNNNLTTNTASFSFTIERPWHLSNTMIAIYVLAILLFSLVMHNIYKQYYTRQRQKVIDQANRELELKGLENEQQVMSFNNERLKQDIENKNRELGLSTMNLIKKNEFLNNLKKELSGLKNVESLKNVITIINKNLNNTDDWKLFEEAFNNADKDFLKKVKEMHPSLTSNDLRLCTYLRLNLSSKEIAPLLNISSRSVEVKRYRLRKKMELSHESSLSNYILEI